MDTVAVVVDPEFVLRQLKLEEDPLGRLAHRSIGVKIVFFRSGPLVEHLEELDAPDTVLAYYRAMAVDIPPATLEPEDFPDRLSWMLAEAALAAGAPFALTDNQELTHLPFPGGRIVDEWDLADALSPGDTGEPMEDGGKLKSVYKCADDVQCHMLTSLLKNESIPYLIKSQEVTSLDGILATGAGFWAEIHVFTEDADQASRLIKEFLSAETEGE